MESIEVFFDILIGALSAGAFLAVPVYFLFGFDGAVIFMITVTLFCMITIFFFYLTNPRKKKRICKHGEPLTLEMLKQMEKVGECKWGDKI